MKQTIKIPYIILIASCALALPLYSSSTKAQEDERVIEWGAFVSNDLRLALSRDQAPSFYRNDATAGVSLFAEIVPYKLSFSADLKLVYSGFANDMEFEHLTTRQGVTPYYLESDAAYIEIVEALPYLDLRIGRQIVQWGAADMFNPTNNLNALDLEDPLMFGETVANQMVRLDWYPGGGNFILTGVWVPLFVPAQLPASSLLVIGDKTSELPYARPKDRLEVEKLRNIYLRNPDNFIVADPEITANMPSYSVKNSQVGVKAQWLVGTIDTSISYYLGRDSLPVSIASYSTQEPTEQFGVMNVYTDVQLRYPKKQVVGFDLAGEIPFLDGMGFWFEGAITFPEQVNMKFDITEIVPTAKVIDAEVVEKTPYFKYTAGFDYSFNEHLFVMGQFIRGFPDEFGAHSLNYYWMGMMELKFLQERLAFRNVVMGEVPHDDEDKNLDEDKDGRVESLASGATNDGKIGSLVYYPELIIKAMPGIEISAGAYLNFGHNESKFNMPAAGPSQVFLRAKASF